MNSTIKQFCQSLTIPCGFSDAEYQDYTNAAMTDILRMTVESSLVLDVFHEHEEVVRHKKLPLSLLTTLQRLSVKEIAIWLAIAIKTVEMHLNNIYRKAEVGPFPSEMHEWCNVN